MKKIGLALCLMLFLWVEAYAQKKGETTFGVNLGYAIEVPNVGLGVEMQYVVMDDIRLEAGFDYYFKNKDVSMWDLNINAHYLIPLSKRIELYPLVGLSYTNWRANTSWFLDEENASSVTTKGEKKERDGKVGANLGAGIEYGVTPDLSLNLEIKYQLLSDLSQAVFSVGVAYRFSLW